MTTCTDPGEDTTNDLTHARTVAVQLATHLLDVHRPKTKNRAGQQPLRTCKHCWTVLKQEPAWPCTVAAHAQAVLTRWGTATPSDAEPDIRTPDHPQATPDTGPDGPSSPYRTALHELRPLLPARPAEAVRALTGPHRRSADASRAVAYLCAHGFLTVGRDNILRLGPAGRARQPSSQPGDHQHAPASPPDPTPPTVTEPDHA